MIGRATITIHLETTIPEGENDPNIYFDKYMENWAKEHDIHFDETVEIDASVGEVVIPQSNNRPPKKVANEEEE